MSKNYYCSLGTNCKMKFVIFTFVCLCAIVQVSFGALSQIPPDKTPGHPGFCNSNDTGPMEQGGTKQLKNCVVAWCNHDASITLASCGVVSFEGCKKVQDFTKPYPDCCPKAEC
ncbi:unnamed protein product [Brassicogethes aeneus]|uniref:Single domain-containing protein n=1 Tax=Brassicogethes aeneus TaxID=1431903 RepID=A0A9P0B9C2_BRAAE|nr:unnamed protein product [Brassicogethes aeneus]